MKNGTVLLTINRKWDNFWSQLVCDWIEHATNSPYIHAREFLNGYLYETTHPGGFRKTVYKGHSESTAIGIPTIDLTDEQILAKLAWWEDKIKRKLPYNYLKLFTALILYKTKPLWEKLGHVPFQDIYKFGDFCFAAVDESYKFIGIDIAKNQIEQISTGKHFTSSEFFTWENLKETSE